jgi:hypothetical protein
MTLAALLRVIIVCHCNKNTILIVVVCFIVNMVFLYFITISFIIHRDFSNLKFKAFSVIIRVYVRLTIEYNNLLFLCFKKSNVNYNSLFVTNHVLLKEVNISNKLYFFNICMTTTPSLVMDSKLTFLGIHCLSVVLSAGNIFCNVHTLNSSDIHKP